MILRTDEVGRITLLGHGFLCSSLVMALSAILNHREIKSVDSGYVARNGVKFLTKIIGGLMLVECYKNGSKSINEVFREFPLSPEGINLGEYFYKAVKELRLIERGIITTKKFSDFAKEIHSTLEAIASSPATAATAIPEKKIRLAYEFFSYLGDQFLLDYQMVHSVADLHD